MKAPRLQYLMSFFTTNKPKLHKEIGGYKAGKGNIQDLSGTAYHNRSNKPIKTPVVISKVLRSQIEEPSTGNSGVV